MSADKLSNLLNDTFSPDAPKTSLGELLRRFETHGVAFSLILLSLPSALPIPAAGYSTIIAIPLFLIGIALLFGKEQVWLPRKVSSKNVEPAKLSKFATKMSKAVQFVEKFSKPRLAALCSGVALRLIGLLICLLAASMAIPLPLTNTLPAGGVFLLGFSFITKDGLLTVLGLLWSVLALAVTTGVIFFGAEIVRAALKGLFS